MASNPLTDAQGPTEARPMPTPANRLLASPVPPPRQEPGGPMMGQGAPNAQPFLGASIEDLEQYLHQTSFIAAAIRDLFMAKAKPTAKDVIGEMGRAVAEQVFSPKEAAQYLSTLPDDPMKIKPWLAQHMQNATMASRMVAEHIAQMAEPRLPQEGMAEPQGGAPMPGGGMPPQNALMVAGAPRG